MRERHSHHRAPYGRGPRHLVNLNRYLLSHFPLGWIFCPSFIRIRFVEVLQNRSRSSLRGNTAQLRFLMEQTIHRKLTDVGHSKIVLLEFKIPKMRRINFKYSKSVVTIEKYNGLSDKDRYCNGPILFRMVLVSRSGKWVTLYSPNIYWLMYLYYFVFTSLKNSFFDLELASVWCHSFLGSVFSHSIPGIPISSHFLLNNFGWSWYFLFYDSASFVLRPHTRQVVWLFSFCIYYFFGCLLNHSFCSVVLNLLIASANLVRFVCCFCVSLPYGLSVCIYIFWYVLGRGAGSLRA